MPKYQKFEDLPVWKEAARLYDRVLDLLEEPNVPLSAGFRNQLDRAALSVSNNVAEGIESATTNELASFLAIARGSGGGVRSMMAVVKDRPRLKPFIKHLQEIRELGESCARQFTAWTQSIESSPMKGKRYLSESSQRIPPFGTGCPRFPLEVPSGLEAGTSALQILRSPPCAR